MKRVAYYFGRFFGILIARLMYRITIQGRENIPQGEAVVYVCNHVTFLDWLLLVVSIPNKVRFVMTHRIWKIPVFGLFFRLFDAIPIAPRKEDEALMERAFESIKNTLERGESVFIFPEGMLTRDGKLCPFKKGIDRILDETPVRVVPCSLDGMWGSYFSHKDAKPFSKPFRRGFFNKVHITIGEPVNAEDASSESLEKIVKEMTNDNS